MWSSHPKPNYCHFSSFAYFNRDHQKPMKTKGTGLLSWQIQSDMSHRPSGPGELDPSCQLRSDQARPVTMGVAIQRLKSVMMMHLPALWGLVPSTRGSRRSRNHSDLSKCTPPCRPYHWNTAKGTTMRKVSCTHPRKILPKKLIDWSH